MDHIVRVGVRQRVGHFAGYEESVLDRNLFLSIQSVKDMSDFFTEMMEGLLPEGVDMSIDRVDMEFVLEAEGKLFWSLSGGHIHSFELDGDVTINSEEEMSVEFGGDSMSIEQSTESSGTFEYRVSTE